MKRLKNAEDIKKFRNELLKEQNNIDPILGIEITDPVLDHQHYAPFKCRRVLQREVNAFEGKVYNAYRRYIRHLSGFPLERVLQHLAVYLTQNYSDMPKHSTAIIAELRPFRRAPAEIQIRILENLQITPAKNAKGRIRQMRKALLDNVISYENLLKRCNEDSNAK